MAAAKVGMKIVEAPETMTVPQLRQFLALEPIKTLYFDPVSPTQDRLLLLRKAIPEFYYCMVYMYINITVNQTLHR